MENWKFEISSPVCACVDLFVWKACNIMSQSPEGSFTMVMPHQHKNCSFSIIYPVEIRLTELSLGQAKSNELSPQVDRTHAYTHACAHTHTHRSSFLCEINILLRPNSDTLNRPLASVGHFKCIQSVIYFFY